MKLRNTVGAALLCALLVSPGIPAQSTTPSDGEGPFTGVCPPEDSPSPADDLTGTSQGLPAEPAETSPDSDRPYWRQNLFGRFFRDQKFFFTAWLPSEARRPAFTLPLLFGTLLATTSSRSSGDGIDLEAERSFQAASSGRINGAARGLSILGDAAAGSLLVGTTYLAGRWSGNDRLAEASSLSAEAVLSAGLWSSVLKALTARTRPSGNQNGTFFDFHPSPGQTVGSFPSGHATGAFALATVFAGVYSDHPWVSWLAYGTAGMIALSRIALGRHFPSDVIVGGMIGNSFGRMVLAHSGEAKPSRFTVEPMADPGRKEVGARWTHEW